MGAGLGTGAGGSLGTGASLGSGGSAAGGATSSPPYAPPTAMLRRLTRSQFRNALFDLTGVSIDPVVLDPDGYNGDFAATGAASVVTSSLGAERYLSVVEEAVGEVFSDQERRDEFVGCVPTASTDPCISDFLSKLGRRAWRRPLSAPELERLLGVVESTATELGSVMDGVAWGTTTLLSSMNFVYRPELGQPGATVNSRLTDFELASRLAFLIWNTLPDEQLLDEAQGGMLSTPEGLKAAAERMLDDPRGRESVAAFAEDYMRQDRILTQAKDAELFPEYGPALQQAIVTDMREVWASVAFDDDASVLDLFSTRKVVANAELATVYGLDSAGLDSNTYEALVLPDDSPRLGILGKLGFLSQFANQKEGSPTLRGKFLSEALLCTDIRPPPGGVALELPESDDETPTTRRERLELHRESPACAGCHSLMDPMGLPFESFDAMGRYRTEEHGLPIDPSGEFEGVPVSDSRELGMAMSTSAKVADCIVRKYYSYAVGHEERDVDQVVVLDLTESFEASGYRLRSLIMDIIASEAFSEVAPASTDL